MDVDDFVAARLSPMLRYATVLTGDPHLAEDLVQDAMVKVALSWRRVVVADNPEAYVRRMVLHEYLSHRRRPWVRRSRPASDWIEAHERAAEGDHATTTVERDDLLSRLAALPPRQRAVLVLRHYEQLADAEIAARMGCREATVRSHASKGLAALRRHHDLQGVTR